MRGLLTPSTSGPVRGRASIVLPVAADLRPALLFLFTGLLVDLHPCLLHVYIPLSLCGFGGAQGPWSQRKWGGGGVGGGCVVGMVTVQILVVGLFFFLFGLMVPVP